LEVKYKEGGDNGKNSEEEEEEDEEFNVRDDEEIPDSSI